MYIFIHFFGFWGETGCEPRGGPCRGGGARAQGRVAALSAPHSMHAFTYIYLRIYIYVYIYMYIYINTYMYTSIYIYVYIYICIYMYTSVNEIYRIWLEVGD